MIEIAAALLLIPVMVWMLLPENRRNREEKRAFRALTRLQNAPHSHDWGRWSEPEERTVYAAGVTRGEVENRLPIRRDYYQERTCSGCGKAEQRVY